MTGSSAGTLITGTLIMAALAYKATDLVKYAVAFIRYSVLGRSEPGQHKKARSGALNGLITLILGCALGVGVVFLMAHTALSDHISIAGHPLKLLPWNSKLVLGLAITSIAALLFDFKKAVDNTDSASTPKLTRAADQARRDRVNAILPDRQALIGQGKHASHAQLVEEPDGYPPPATEAQE